MGDMLEIAVAKISRQKGSAAEKTGRETEGPPQIGTSTHGGH
jgi:hypothetical protein